MNLRSCPYENEVRELITRGQWPQAAAPDLRSHADACRSCSDLVLVAESFRQARASTIAAARPGPAGVLWWRAQLRRRNAAVARLSRPILSAEIFALAFALVAGISFLIFEAMQSDSWLTWLQQLPQSAALHWDELFSAAALNSAWMWMMLGPALLLAGVAVYMVTDRQ